ncbi:Hypothetical protein A7982_09284 [Minicystis rosea]|nr:Hypothetical protein A7982_09284 [Minicystis rosea]
MKPPFQPGAGASSFMPSRRVPLGLAHRATRTNDIVGVQPARIVAAPKRRV